MVKKVIFHAGLTKGHPEKDVWSKTYAGLEWEFSDEVDEVTMAKAFARMRAIVEQELGAPDLSQIPQFNPEELMKHEWKGRKQPDGSYAKGSLAWGWEFKDKFSEDVIKALEKGPVTIDKYEFTLGGALVNVKKKKGK